MQPPFKALAILAVLAGSVQAEEALSPTASVSELDGLKARIDDIQKAWHVEGYTQLRYDDQQYKISGIAAPNSGKYRVGSDGTKPVNTRGAYIKKFEIKTSGEVVKNLKWVAGYDFAEGKVKDLGTEWSHLPALIGAEWTLKVGQFRQPFGIEPQTGTPQLAFHERSLINGGASPLTPPASAAWNTQLIGERVLGIQVLKSRDFGKFGVNAALAASDDGGDQAKGSNSLATGFPSQFNDENPTLTGRLGVSCGLWGGHKLGVSYQRNSKDTVFMASSPAAQSFDETLGLDWRCEIGKKAFAQAEWIGQNAGINGASGLTARREGWYAESGANLLGIFVPQASDKLELLGRYERVNTNLHAVTYSPTLTAATAGIKWTYGKNSQTSLNYTAYGVDDDFGAAGNTGLFSLQDIVTF
jgi:hypothetical protein